ncbi:hypothetical protein L915_09579 [Phytophthora nicotianae]|uniref:Uncharacterized protein n=1 Tax=Phytophthora nicotianae TaxID=4792 RepID=W2GS54_PHYNI|nr:hypothetical protein L915_09579 [Phytophthora nicotianae]ETL39114.1 hypothetical protein L916_09480 [Phytophthora nicotianae]
MIANSITQLSTTTLHEHCFAVLLKPEVFALLVRYTRFLSPFICNTGVAIDRPRRACTSRKLSLQDLVDDDSSRSDSDASVSSTSVDDSTPTNTSGSKTSSDHSADESVTWPDLAKTEFVSCEGLHAYLDLYQKETFQASSSNALYEKRGGEEQAD